MTGVAKAVCDAGVCVSLCLDSYGNCNLPDALGFDDGCETNLDESIHHCGGCGRECQTNGGVNAADCAGGVCVSTCRTGYANVRRPEAPEIDDGCEVEVATDVDHCGAEDRACASTNVRERSCQAGVCISTCEVGYWNVNQPEAPAADDGCETECVPTTGGPDLVRLPEGYCIDRTEVTRGHYATWLDTHPPLDGQGPDCSWNSSFEPDASCMESPSIYHESGWENHPVVCVDWCDAYAYCAAVGKRLCGNIDGGSNGFSAHADAAESQWYNACISGEASYLYPYGDTLQQLTCNGDYYQDSLGTSVTVEVASLLGCQSPDQDYDTVYDMSGNVWEWEDSCDGSGRLASCRVRGGSFYGSETPLSCSSDLDYERDWARYFIGFRCCAP